MEKESFLDQICVCDSESAPNKPINYKRTEPEN